MNLHGSVCTSSMSTIKTFKANAPGTICMNDFKDECRRKADTFGSKTAVALLLGKFDIDIMNTAPELLEPIYNDVVVWRNVRPVR